MDDKATTEVAIVTPRARTRGLKQKAFLLALSGAEAGAMWAVEPKTVLGRGAVASLRIRDEGISRKHCVFERRPSGRVTLRDLGSTNGTVVNGEPLEGVVTLTDGDKIQIGTTTILKLSYQDQLDVKFQRDLYDSALKDPLTGLFNRRHFWDRLTAEYAYQDRNGGHLGLCILDIDHFKRVNDTLGHPAGDAVLKTLGPLIEEVVRKEDLCARYGGEEFAVLLRDIPLDNAYVMARRLRQVVEQHEFWWHGQRIPVTASFGVAAVPEPRITTAEGLVGATDEALYAAKAAGRNCVRAHGRAV